MIEVQSNEQGRETVIEARSNLSMTLDRLAAVFLGLSAVVLLVALGPTMLGYWPVLVAAIIHLVLVGWCLRLAWRGNWARERMTIDPESLTIEHYDVHRQSLSRWPAAWVRVAIEKRKLGNQRVVVACQGRRQVVGAFLPPHEQQALADALNDGLRPVTAWSGRK